MKKIFLVLIALVLTLSFTEAKYVQSCKVKYKSNYEWSQYYNVDVTFMTGYELNTETQTYNYDMYSVYGIVFWGDGKATIIKISTYLACGSEVMKSCIDNQISNLQGEAQDGRDWEICTTGYCY